MNSIKWMLSILTVWVLWLCAVAAIAIFLGGCKPSVFGVDKVECPIEVPPEIIAAYLGCAYDVKTQRTSCTTQYAVPALTLDACDMVTPDGGACE